MQLLMLTFERQNKQDNGIYKLRVEIQMESMVPTCIEGDHSWVGGDASLGAICT